ncbi:hypothetical protein BpHYR1_021589 [Brachionus plicatilis]|uniref:Uncharacterized protein n=1 Tax=Brachionus plicatilis TaxID=10195 RepID=A0A3M7RDG3_BRAPC|nr:hypothetical protein BpHYR1_021589 [Brachionus plicatilis]
MKLFSLVLILAVLVSLCAIGFAASNNRTAKGVQASGRNSSDPVKAVPQDKKARRRNNKANKKVKELKDRQEKKEKKNKNKKNKNENDPSKVKKQRKNRKQKVNGTNV